MDIIEAIYSRKSIRGFKPDPIPKETLTKVLEAAIKAPSGTNSQTWEITVVAGEALDNIKKGNIKKLTSGAKPNPDVYLEPFSDVYRQRQIDLAIQIFQLMGITREDKEKRNAWFQRGYRFFDAPAAIILYADRSVSEARTQFDLGLIAQNICLAAFHYGLGTCIEQQGIVYPDVVLKFTGIPESKRITIAIAIGYTDWDFPVNKLVSAREPLENVVTWCGYD